MFCGRVQCRPASSTSMSVAYKNKSGMCYNGIDFSSLATDMEHCDWNMNAIDVVLARYGFNRPRDQLYWILWKRQTVGITELKCKISRSLIYKDTTSNWPIPDQWFIYHSIYKSVKFIDFPPACHYNKNCWPNELVWLCMFLTEDAEVKHQQNQNKPFVRVQRLTSPLNNRKSSLVHPLRIHSRTCT